MLETNKKFCNIVQFCVKLIEQTQQVYNMVKKNNCRMMFDEHFRFTFYLAPSRYLCLVREIGTKCAFGLNHTIEIPFKYEAF